MIIPSCSWSVTIEYIKNQKSIGQGVLDNLSTSRENVSEIVRVTPSYKLADRAKIIREINLNLYVMHTFTSTETYKNFV